MARIESTEGFEKSLKRLDRKIREQALRAIQKFEHNHRLPGLNLEKLSGTEAWSIRVNDNFRILLVRDQDDEGELWVLDEIDTHDIYRRRG